MVLTSVCAPSDKSICADSIFLSDASATFTLAFFAICFTPSMDKESAKFDVPVAVIYLLFVPNAVINVLPKKESLVKFVAGFEKEVYVVLNLINISLIERSASISHCKICLSCF